MHLKSEPARQECFASRPPLLGGLPKQLGAGRAEIGREAARIVSERPGKEDGGGERIVLTPKLDLGATLKR